MNKLITTLFILLSTTIFSQTDFSDNWEDFYSYNNVKDFTKVNDKIYAIVDNAVFIYDTLTQENTKISSVQGLSGETTSSIYFNETFNRLVIGYTTGLIEVINENGSIHISNDIEDFIITGSKQINHIFEFGNKLYISTPFAIVEYDIENLVFGDTFFIGNGSSSVNIHQTAVFQDTIFAVTENGIYYADVNNPFLIDFNNWQQPQGSFVGNFNTLTTFNSKLYTSRNSTLYEIQLPNTLVNVGTFSGAILNLKATDEFLNVTTQETAFTLDISLAQVNATSSTTEFDFNLKNSFSENQIIYLATDTFGILSKPFQSNEFQEIHPEGPQFNSAFSISVHNDNLWVVYGAYDASYNFLFNSKGFDHFNGMEWINTPFDVNNDYKILVDIAIDPNHENRAILSSYDRGLLEVVDDEIVNHFDELNSDLEIWEFADTFLPRGVLVSGSVFDSQGDLWVTNPSTDFKIKKFDTNGNWSNFSIDEVLSGNKGLGEISIDNAGNKWIASRAFGAIIFNENGENKKVLTTDTSTGNLPDNNVKAIIADRNNRIWIGTIKGLRVFSGTGGIFEAETYQANPILIRLEGGTGEEQAEELLGDQPINTIAIDGADNKWFGTRNSGVLGTNPSGQETLHTFNTTNSPLPSNEIIKIRVDNSTGKVYFATTKGIVAFNNKVAPFGDTLGETYAYPNPSTSSNEFITIDGRNGTHLPRGTNVKILDSAGYLVFETNVVEGQEVKGGKVVWNKRNLAGTNVASGIYVVLLTLPDKSETSITKIAIIH